MPLRRSSEMRTAGPFRRPKAWQVALPGPAPIVETSTTAAKQKGFLEVRLPSGQLSVLCDVREGI